MFFKIGALGNFANLTRNTCVGVSFNKVAGLQDWNFIKRDSNAGVLKLLRTPIFTEHLQWLLLSLNPFDPIFLYFISHSTITPIESLYNQWYRKNYFPLSKKNKLNNSKKVSVFSFFFFFDGSTISFYTSPENLKWSWHLTGFTQGFYLTLILSRQNIQITLFT